MNATSVCKAIKSSRRREDLSFGHHAEVSNRPDAEELLDWCEQTGARRAGSAIQLGRLHIQARLGELMPSKQGKKTTSPTKGAKLGKLAQSEKKTA